MSQVGGAVYAMLVTPDGATAYRTALSARQLDQAVDGAARQHHRRGERAAAHLSVRRRPRPQALCRPVRAGRRPPRRASHIIFEPAGAMLQLPPNLLVTDDASVAAYRAAGRRRTSSISAASPGSAATATSRPRSRRAPSATCARRRHRRRRSNISALGQNSRVVAAPSSSPHSARDEGQVDCSWPLAAWNKPISASELVTARSMIGAARRSC